MTTFKSFIIAVIIGLLCFIALCGCASRRASRTPVTTATPDGLDVALTASDFDRVRRTLDGLHLEPYGEGDQRAMETDPTFFDHGTGWWFKVPLGMYVEDSKTCYVVAFDPQHLSPSEQLALRHEHAHRVQALYGWSKAAPVWASLPRRYLTHPEITKRLEQEGWIK